MKILHFSGRLPKLILQGKKTITWRINDEKDIKEGDELSLCDNHGNQFAKVIVIKTKETVFGKLTKEDKECHEKFDSDKKMHETYSNYYNIKVSQKTKVKVIYFRLKPERKK